MNNYQALMDKFKAERDEIWNRDEFSEHNPEYEKVLYRQAEAQARLLEYSNHEPGCLCLEPASHNSHKQRCTCGFDTLIAELAKDK